MRNRQEFIHVSLLIMTILFLLNACSNAPVPSPTATQPSPTFPIPTASLSGSPFEPTGLALTPPMGWNSFNHFGCSIDQAMVMEIADAMVTSGMQAAGYEYVNIDDCWMAMERDQDGNLQGDPTKFPNGMKFIADYVHSKGLKIGLYLDRGTKTCAGYPGSYGFEVQDANQMAAWGIDYIKYDNCSVVGNMYDDYTNMRNALNATGRPIVFSMCTWGFPGFLVPQLDIAHLWRTSSDIKDTWDSMITIGEANNVYAAYAEPGHWNDPDMLEIGNGGMTLEEYRTHFTLWAIMAAPLIAGNDIRTMDDTIRDILIAPEVIAVNQDPLGIQGTQVTSLSDLDGREVWAKPLMEPNTRVVMLLNRTEKPTSIAVYWDQIGLSAGPALLRNLWDRRDLGMYHNGYTATVPPHGVVLIKVTTISKISQPPEPSK